MQSIYPFLRDTTELQMVVWRESLISFTFIKSENFIKGYVHTRATLC